MKPTKVDLTFLVSHAKNLADTEKSAATVKHNLLLGIELKKLVAENIELRKEQVDRPFVVPLNPLQLISELDAHAYAARTGGFVMDAKVMDRAAQMLQDFCIEHQQKVKELEKELWHEKHAVAGWRVQAERLDKELTQAEENVKGLNVIIQTRTEERDAANGRANDTLSSVLSLLKREQMSGNDSTIKL